MFFVLIIMVLFVLISIYFFFRAEKLQRQLMIQQRQSSDTRKENKALVESMVLIATRGQEFSINRLQRLKKYGSTNEQLMIHAELISPLINNYSIIFMECLKGKGKLKTVSKKCFENSNSAAYKKFVALIVTSDEQLKRYWASDSLSGFLFLVDALLTLKEDNTMVLSTQAKSTCVS